MQGEAAIALNKVTVRFGDFTAAQDIDIRIRPGEFLSIVGPSGCGKTTLLNLVAGLIGPQNVSGQCLVRGKAPELGSHAITYMLARDALCPWRTALENAELGSEIRGVGAVERRERARQLLADVGLGSFESAYPKSLSHGMRQRVALARTFCMDSPILLMDEPFGALDAQTKLQLEETLLRLWERTQQTVVFITHDLAEAVLMSDRVIVMSPRPGRIKADVPIDLGRPRSVRGLQKDPAYHDLYSRVWTELEEGIAS